MVPEQWRLRAGVSGFVPLRYGVGVVLLRYGVGFRSQEIHSVDLSDQQAGPKDTPNVSPGKVVSTSLSSG